MVCDASDDALHDGVDAEALVVMAASEIQVVLVVMADAEAVHLQTLYFLRKIC
ncbi:hypothetical protein GCM10022209_29640 [Chitinophaga oryziterrae]